MKSESVPLDLENDIDVVLIEDWNEFFDYISRTASLFKHHCENYGSIPVERILSFVVAFYNVEEMSRFLTNTTGIANAMTRDFIKRRIIGSELKWDTLPIYLCFRFTNTGTITYKHCVNSVEHSLNPDQIVFSSQKILSFPSVFDVGI